MTTWQDPDENLILLAALALRDNITSSFREITIATCQNVVRLVAVLDGPSTAHERNLVGAIGTEIQAGMPDGFIVQERIVELTASQTYSAREGFTIFSRADHNEENDAP